MSKRGKFAGILFVLLYMAFGCASTGVDRSPTVTGPIPRPATVWVHDFAATPEDMPAGSTLAGRYAVDKPPTSEQIAAGRKLGMQITNELVELIRGMGMPAKRAARETAFQLNDIVLEGYLVSFHEGDEMKRVTIGLGSGESELKVAVEGFQMTASGLLKLGSGATSAEGSKTPGAGAGGVVSLITRNPLSLIVSTGMKAYGEKSGSSKLEGRATQTAKEIAGVLKQRFQEQGWIPAATP